VANRFFNPNEQFCDSAGLPYAGGTLDFYASGTSTRLNTYSDSALSIANTNPVVLDSAGRAGSVFLQNLAYKVTLSDVNNNLIWTEDPVYSSDYSTRAKLTSGAGSPNGSVAGTAGSAGIGADTYWDNVNNILYVCTTTGNAASAVWTAVNASAAAAIVPAPQGYLTPTSGTPVITSDVISATSLVYTPYVGNLVPIYTGTGFNPTVFSELTLTLTSSQAASTLYDVFVFNNSGVLTLATGPAWSNSTPGSCSRGSPTALTRLSGIWVNNIQITGKNGANTFTIPANQATYLGSIFIDSVAGQITCHCSYGQSRKWAIWNAYNRVPLYLKAGDSTASWSYSSTTVRPSNNNTANSLTIFTGLAEERFYLSAAQKQSIAQLTGTTITSAIGIGYNSTTVISGLQGSYSFAMSSAGSTTLTPSAMVAGGFLTVPALGIQTVTALESSSASSQTFFGTETNMVLAAQWRG
jgi:hypothetical protein